MRMSRLTLLHRTERLNANQSLPARLLAVTHFVQKQTMDRLLKRRRYGKLSVAHSPYMVLLLERDRSPGELADKLGISKQACSKTVGELEALGLLGRRSNPQDSRSSILSLSAKGLELVDDGVRIANEIQTQMFEFVGEARLERLLEVLSKLCVGMDVQQGHHASIENAMAAKVGCSPTGFASLLPGLSMDLHRKLMASLNPDHIANLPANVGPVLGVISEGRQRLQYIAGVLGVSKQSVAAIALDLERLGYATRSEDPEDRRQVVVCLSPQGEGLLAEVVAGVDKIEAEILSILGAADYRFLDEAMSTFFTALTVQYDGAGLLRARIQQLARQAVDELGVTGARSLAQLLVTMTRGKE